MKRPIFGRTALAALIATLAACSPEAAPQPRADPDAGTSPGWTRPPEVLSVRRAAASLIFSGEAEPGGRVVLRSEGGPAYAAAADARGRFEIRMAAPMTHLLLRPETQVGQDAAPSPDRLLIVGGGQGPIAVLRPGGPTRRLDAAPALGAVDSDGRMRLASGRADGPVTVQAGGSSVSVTPDASGRWNVMLRPSDVADQIQVGGARFNWPGEGGGGRLLVARAGGGWRIAWTGPGGAPQSTWLPDGPSGFTGD
ncbi:MAG TPA: hypothetical protein VGB60_12255 [Brevundimonas sp.]|uniref:hypothetical protein n=1 Tax=Brevundimonas sp. TaxID=1871086 RepID=UPI002ED94E66